MTFAFVSVQFVTFPEGYPEKPPETLMFRTDWDEAWLEALQPLIADIPYFDQMIGADIDVPVSQLQLMDEAAFHDTSFYEAWVKPQDLRDTLNTNIIKRGNMTALLSAPTPKGRELFDDEDYRIMRELTPHIRRALLISDLLDEKNAQVQILRNTLDKLALAVILIEADGRLVYTNGTGEDVLSRGDTLTVVSKKLHVQSALHRDGFKAAVDRACSGNDMDIQNWGNGIPLPTPSGEVAVAYVLPMGKSERRQSLGPGMAAVFVTSGANAQPPSVEVISAVTGLTTAEANVALQIANGSTPQEVSETLDVSINTVRKHLANAFEKTGHRNQAGLSAAIGRLSLPARDLLLQAEFT